MRTHSLSLSGFLLFLWAGVCAVPAACAQGGVWDVPRSGGETITEPSPEATSMRRFQDYPVSYAAGTADISIPLLELPGGSVGVSLGVSYHTGGIRRLDLPTGTGLGWTLTGLGQVSRQINGFPDEWTGSPKGSVKFDLREDPYDLEYLISVLEAGTDTERDRYSYSLPGYTGSFMIVDGEIVQLPETELTIQREASSSDAGATEAFIIITPQGYRYRFAEKEHVDFRFVPAPMPCPYYSRDYTGAVTAWQLSRITGPDDVDEITVSYTDVREWTRDHNRLLRGYSMTYGKNHITGSYQAEIRESDASPCGANETVFRDQKLPYRISGRSGSVEFTIDRTAKTGAGPLDFIRSMELKDASGNRIRRVTFDNASVFNDGRRRLDGIEVTEDGTVTDRYIFGYNEGTYNPGYDLFGFANGASSSSGSHSILNHSLQLSETRMTNENCLYSNMLCKIKDITGLETEIVYEPSAVDIDRISDSQIITGRTVIGPRVRSIWTRDAVTGRTRRREYTYEQPRCNIPLRSFLYGDFISQSGDHSITNISGTAYSYGMGICYTSSATSRGYPLENARIYYGRVTETLSGTGMERPVRTVYEYDLSGTGLIFQRYDMPSFFYDDCPGLLKGSCRYLGGFENRFVTETERKLAEYHPAAGYIEDHCGSGPLLSCRTEYEWSDGRYRVRRQTRNHYSRTGYRRYLAGRACESAVFRFCDFNREPELNITSVDDVAHFPVTLAASRHVCDSTVVTVYYHEGNDSLSREIKTVYINRPEDLPQSHGFTYVSCEPYGHVSYYPYGTVTSSGGESAACYRILSENSCDIFLSVTAVSRGLRRLPETEKRVLTTFSGKDSVQTCYRYGMFSGGRDGIIRPVSVTVSVNAPTDSMVPYRPAVISERVYTGYDSRGRITAMRDEAGRSITARWPDSYDLLSELTLPDAGLTTRYTYRPLVGCTSVESPGGRKHTYAYFGGRLVSETNTAGEPLVSYSTRLRNDGTEENDSGNRFEKKIYGSSQSRDIYTETVYYDGYGMPVQTVSTIPKDIFSQPRMKRTSTAYDAMDRPVLHILPVPADTCSYSDRPLEDAVAKYADRRPYSTVAYRLSADDRPVSIIAEGKNMEEHPVSIRYRCNSGSDEFRKCRRYILADSRDDESVTLSGLYPAGTLDVTDVTDPDGCRTLTFADWKGFRILERRVVADNTFADTYYLYDPLGNIRVVLQPEGVARMNTTGKKWTLSDGVMEQYAFISRYDRRGNLIYSKVPGCGATEMRYDRYSRPVLRATATMRERDEAEYTLYDATGRPVLSGIGPYIRTEQAFRETVSPVASFDPLSPGIDSTGYAVSDPALMEILSGSRVTSACYYDGYGFMELPGFSSLPDGVIPSDTQHAAGRLTGRRLSVYSGGEDTEDYTVSAPGRSLCTVTVHDAEGNAVTGVSSAVPAGYHVVTNTEYTRQGIPENVITGIHTPDSIIRVEDQRVSDPAGNPLDRFTVLRGFSKSEACAATVSRIGADRRRAIQVTAAELFWHYDDVGRLIRYSNYGRDYNVEYGYDLRGRMTSLQSRHFSQTLAYDTGERPLYNGNISRTVTVCGQNAPVAADYSYDRLSRLTAMESSDGFSTSYSYTLNSAPLAVTRSGLMSDGTAGTVDDLSVEYDGNRPVRVTDSADPVILETSLDFAGGEARYSYDSDGRLIRDTGRGISITYSPADRPAVITADDGSRMEYLYDADGRKAGEVYTPAGPGRTETRWYIGPAEFISAGDRPATVSRINFDWGYFDGNSREYVYIRDYQGNIRTVTDIWGGGPYQQTGYYPYGLPAAISTGAAANRYKYGGKELETRRGLNFHDFGSRMLFSDIALFNRPDPKAQDYPHLSPYSYCAANPIRYIDPTGEELRYYDGDKEYIYGLENGRIVVYDTKNNVVDPSTLSVPHQLTVEYLNEYLGSDIGKQVVSGIIESDKTVSMTYDGEKGDSFNSGSGIMTFDPFKDECGISFEEANGYNRKGSATINLSHEIAHAEDWIKGTINENVWVVVKDRNIPKSEIYACRRENQYRAEIGFPQRIAYSTRVSDKYLEPIVSTLLVTNKGLFILKSIR